MSDEDLNQRFDRLEKQLESKAEFLPLVVGFCIMFVILLLLLGK